MTTHLNGKHQHKQIDFDDTPPPAGPAIFVRRLKGEEGVTCAILGDKVYGIWSHWQGKKSEPHFRNADDCPGCIARRPKRWKGFLHVWDYATNKEIFLELTPASASQLGQQLGRNSDLRGERIRVQRTKGDNGRLTVAVLQAEPKIDVLPKEKDPRQTILKLWGVAQEDPQGWLDSGDEDESDARFRL